MDLTLALGRPIGDMPEREFRRWQEYARIKGGLPHRLIQLYLAQIALHVALGRGVEKAKLSDYLFDPLGKNEPRPFDEDNEFNG